MVAICEAVLGPDYEIVEVGFDVPVKGGRVVDELVPITQKHDIEGLVMGADA